LVSKEGEDVCEVILGRDGNCCRGARRAPHRSPPCNQGDKGACVRFGVLIGENKQRQVDWRRAHADWFWWERL
jgi:hypothetical protein